MFRRYLMGKNIVMLLFVLFTFMFATQISAEGNREIMDAHSENGLACADCHLTDTPEKKPKSSTCFDCHIDYPSVAELTAELRPNPHNSHQGELRCTYCHSPHGNEKLYCNECHELTDYKFK